MTTGSIQSFPKLLVGVQTGVRTLENYSAVYANAKRAHNVRQAIPLLCKYPTEMCLCFHQET